MTDRVELRLAQTSDAKDIADMLWQLARDLGDLDTFASTPETIAAHGFGPDSVFSSYIARSGDTPVGLAVFFRHFSTTLGRPGVYVQDLWIAPQMRGQRLGERLLAAVAHHAEQSWQAGYMQLTVYQDNPRAAQFYQRLGFSTHANDTPMSARNQVFKDLLQQGRKPA